MARRRRKRESRLDVTAENIGSALGHIAARLEAWKNQRAELAAEIQKVMAQGQRLIADLGDTASERFTQARRTGGRPKGYKVSATTRAKLRAAWRRRKRAGK